MSQESAMIKQLLYAVKGYSHDKDVDEIEKIITDHSLAAGAAAAVAGWIPAAGTVANVVAIGFVWAMYYRLCQAVGIQISKAKLKTLASVIVAEVAAYIGILLAANIILSLIPGLNLGTVVLGALVNFAMVYAAGTLFILMMTKLCKNVKPGEMNKISDEEFKKVAKSSISKSDVKKATKEGLKTYKDAKDDPRYSGDGVEPFKD